MENRFFTTGEFAKKANTSVRTIRYYDKEGLLKPSHVSDNGYRLYTDQDFAKLQKIMTLKYLGFSLEEIRELTIQDQSIDYVARSLEMQLRLVQSQIENLVMVQESLQESAKLLSEGNQVNWDRMLQLIHMVNMEHSLAKQYQSGENVDIRIRLHREYSTNKIPWFSWVYEQLQLRKGMKVLEIGCGNGELWSNSNVELQPGSDFSLTLTDNSVGMIADTKERLKHFSKIQYRVMDAQTDPIPAKDGSVDLIIANHVLFYVKNRELLYREIKRCLSEDGVFICSTYGQNHMKEMTQLVQSFDSRINLSAISLFEVFGLENGEQELLSYFSDVERIDYEDTLVVDRADPIVDYILSCHGNQREFLRERTDAFRESVWKQLEEAPDHKIRITKQAGIFLCRRPIHNI